MLSFSTVESHTLDILKGIMSLPLFNEMRLVGGTSLALQLEHRKSVDLDFFGKLVSTNEEVKDCLRQLGQLTVIKENDNIKIYMIDGIKIDFVNYCYNWIDECIQINGIRLASMKDIAAMKVNAVEGRGTKKDFIDIYFLLQNFTLQEILDFYAQKYPENSFFRALMSLIYFDDAESQIPPEMYSAITWEEMKIAIQKAVKEFQS